MNFDSQSNLLRRARVVSLSLAMLAVVGVLAAPVGRV
jgi:hypothetical protein